MAPPSGPRAAVALDPAQPLAGVRVLSFGQYYAGPLVAMHLAEQGASVTQIDPPSGPRLPTAATSAMRAKVARVLALDLATARGRAEAHALALASDVLIENFRPGVMRRLEARLSPYRHTPHGLP